VEHALCLFLITSLYCCFIATQNLTDLMLIYPDLAIVPITIIPAHTPPSSDRYDVIWFGAPSLGPPPEMIISSSFVDTTQPVR
jgi:hypothetical protein